MSINILFFFKKRAESIVQAPAGGDAWSKEVGTDIKALWEDPVVQRTFSTRSNAYQLNDSAA
jgi:hypothetical protein